MKSSAKYEYVTCDAAEAVPVEELAMILAQIFINAFTRKANEHVEKISDPVQ